MASKLRYFVRLDSQNKPVAGSLVARPRKPKINGTWYEISYPNCCNQTLTDEPDNTVGDEVTFTLNCGDTVLITVTLVTEITELSDIVDALNAAFPFLGTFSEDGTNIILDVTSSIAIALCQSDSLTMVITVAIIV